jgi:sodium-dependent multivitamin transporter 6
LGLFCLGIFVPFANPKGAIIGTLTSLCFMFWMFIGFNVSGIKYPKKPLFEYGCNQSNQSIDINFENQQPVFFNITERQGIDNFYAVSYTWYGGTAVTVVILVGSLVSLITGKNFVKFYSRLIFI